MSTEARLAGARGAQTLLCVTALPGVTALLCLAALPCLTAVPCVTAVAVAQAPEAEPAAEAQRLFYEGVSLLEEGRYESARAVLERALALEVRASTGFNLASALHALGRSWEAHRMLARIDGGELGPLPEGYAEPAARLREAVRAALGRLELSVAIPDEAAVRVDGEAAGVVARGSALARTLAPGAHVVVAEAEGYAPWTREVRLEPGQLARITVSLVPATALGADPPDDSTSNASDGGDDLGLAVGLTIGVVALLAVGGVVLGVVLDQPACDPLVGCIDF